MKQKISIWQIVFYLSMSIVILWLILISIGIIQSSFWLEYRIPIAALGLGIFAFYHSILESLQKLVVNIKMVTTKWDNLNSKEIIA